MLSSVENCGTSVLAQLQHPLYIFKPPSFLPSIATYGLSIRIESNFVSSWRATAILHPAKLYVARSFANVGSIVPTVRSRCNCACAGPGQIFDSSFYPTAVTANGTVAVFASGLVIVNVEEQALTSD